MTERGPSSRSVNANSDKGVFMAKVDLHVHSCFSKHPSEWFLQRIGTRESYIEPEEIYRAAKREGMDYVTITDHNTIEGAMGLKERHPQDVFTGLEATAYFPEDGTKIHVLVWGLSEAQFQKIDALRTNIYELRSYLLEQRLAHAVAHLTYSVNGMLSLEHIERLLLMFDHFELSNGSRERINSETLSQVFAGLTPGKMQDLCDKYFIQPNLSEPWRKGMVGGSDDHSGLFIAKTYTCAQASTPEEFLDKIKRKQTQSAGRHNDYLGLAFAIYKVAYDFSRSKNPFASSLLSAVNSLIFDDSPMTLKKQIILKRLKRSSKAREHTIGGLLADLVNTFQEEKKLSSEAKLAVISDKVTEASDELFRRLFEKVSRDLKDGDLVGLMQSISGFLPGIFLTLPFFTSLSALNGSRRLLDELSEGYISPDKRKQKKILWFSDTLLELSGVSATLQELAHLTHKRNLDLHIVTCLPPEHERAVTPPPNVLDLPSIHAYTPDFFSTFTLRLPSVLASLKLICEAAPDEIYISTPGPLGLLGVLAAKLLHVPSTAVYHTDFTRQARQIIGDETVCRLTEDYVNWFHSLTDSVAVPTRKYMSLLERRGIKREKLRPFRRGIDPTLFAPCASSAHLDLHFGITDGVTLLHSGRVSKEKNLDFLAAVYKEVLSQNPKVNLIFAGDGPYLDELRAKMRPFKRVFFTGRMERSALPQLYSACNALVFPSVTDTFGMVVLEAQSCGLPAIVSDFGGPQEIIVNGKTGFVAEANNLEDWKNKIEGVIAMITSYPRLYLEMRVNARRNTTETYSWDLVLQDIFGPPAADTWAAREREMYNPFGDIVNLEKMES